MASAARAALVRPGLLPLVPQALQPDDLEVFRALDPEVHVPEVSEVPVQVDLEARVRVECVRR